MTPLLPAQLAAVLRYARGYANTIADPRAANDGVDRYRDLIAEDETDAAAHEIVAMSGCGLVLRGLLCRILANPPPCLRAPYRIGRALADLEDAARFAGAIYHDPFAMVPGDIVHVGAGVGGPEHVYMAVEVGAVGANPYGGLDATGLEGGWRLPSGVEGIRERVRVVSRDDGVAAVWDRVDDGPVRVVVDCYSLAGLVATFGFNEALLPDP